jgi:hypothetical protein
MAQLRAVKAETGATGHGDGATGHGGARPGAGRKPKALRYASELAAAEEKIMSALPAAIDSLIASANCGDVAAAKYLLDRAFGRIKEQTLPPSEDTTLPYDESDLERDEKVKAFADSCATW